VHVRIDQDKCLGYGNCVLAAPEVFEIGDDDGVVHALVEQPDDSLRSKVEQAVAVCPTSALSIASDS
jgi:ferredoxin